MNYLGLEDSGTLAPSVMTPDQVLDEVQRLMEADGGNSD